MHYADLEGDRIKLASIVHSGEQANTLCTTETPQPAWFAILIIPNPCVRSARIRPSISGDTGGLPTALPDLVPLALARAIPARTRS